MPRGRSRRGEIDSVRRLGRRILDLTLDRTLGAGAGRAWSGASRGAIARRFAAPPPRTGRSEAAVLRRLRAILDDSMRMSHPRLFGLFTPAPLPIAALADMAAAFMNQSPDAWKAGPAATEVEAGMVRAFAREARLGPRAFGVLTGGGGAANLIALKLARDRSLGIGTRRRGLHRRRAGRLRVYASDQAHFSVARALDVLGIGADALVPIPTGRDRRLPVDRLARVLARDRSRGLVPMAIVATAGTTSTGNVDPLSEIARCSRRYGAFLHVDAAYGGALLFSRRHRSLLRGIERADTIAIDPHKWLFQPFSLAVLLARDRDRLRASCATEPEYLRKDLEREGDRLDFYQHSLEGSRPFRGLKMDLTLQLLGRDGLGALVDRTMDVARHLERRVLGDERFETCGAPVELATVVLRYLPEWARAGGTNARSRRRAPRGTPTAADRRRLDRVQLRIQHEVERRGEAWF
ncbi:MAG TPA: pyridoxal-dependent decarboxylase, partial [Candidatus Polarisedimenticolia bacterium]|nr:pyridoxal-dependent decarboxylase [Candidatus Polarisedimenticolia bacterium]